MRWGLARKLIFESPDGDIRKANGQSGFARSSRGRPVERLHMGVSIRSGIKLASTAIPGSEVVVLCRFVESNRESMSQFPTWCFEAQTEVGVSFVQSDRVINRFTQSVGGSVTIWG